MNSEQIIDFLKTDIRKYESPERYGHTLSVLGECVYLADVFGVAGDDRLCLMIAALCHDITKEMPDDESRAFCTRHGIKYVDSPVLHQDTAPAFIVEKYGDIPEIVDKRVLSAVSLHTTGSPVMSVCDMILFVADFIEPTRKYEDCKKAREYIRSECEKISKNKEAADVKILCDAVVSISRNTLDHLKKRGREIDQRTVETASKGVCVG